MLGESGRKKTGIERKSSMTERPALDKKLDSKIFRDFYYLKEELVDFCRKNDLPVSGGKIELTYRIAYFSILVKYYLLKR